MMPRYGEVTQTAQNANAMLASGHRRALRALAPTVIAESQMRVLDVGCADGVNSIAWVRRLLHDLCKVTVSGRTLELCGLSLESAASFSLAEKLVESIADSAVASVPDSTRDAFVEALLKDAEVQQYIDAGRATDGSCRNRFPEARADALAALRVAFPGVRLELSYVTGSFYEHDAWAAAAAAVNGPFHTIHTATADHWLNRAQRLPRSKCQANLESNARTRAAVRSTWLEDQTRLLGLASERLHDEGYIVSGGLIHHEGRFPADAIYIELERELDARSIDVDFQSYFPNVQERREAIRAAGLFVHEASVHIQQDAYSARQDTMRLPAEEQARIARDIRNVGESWGRWKVEEGTRAGQGLSPTDVDSIFDAVEARLLERIRSNPGNDVAGIAPYYYYLCLIGKRPPSGELS